MSQNPSSATTPEVRQAALGDGARNDAPPHEGGERDGARFPSRSAAS